MRIVMDYRPAIARRLADAHIARNDRFKDKVWEVLANLALNIAGEARTAVVHRQQHSGDD
jgi:hypothetical protein